MTRKKTDEKLPTNIRERDGKFTYRYRIPITKIINGVEKKTAKKWNPHVSIRLARPKISVFLLKPRS